MERKELQNPSELSESAKLILKILNTRGKDTCTCTIMRTMERQYHIDHVLDFFHEGNHELHRRGLVTSYPRARCVWIHVLTDLERWKLQPWYIRIRGGKPKE